MALCVHSTQQLQVAIRRLGGTIMVLCPITSLAIRCIMMAPRPTGRGADVTGSYRVVGLPLGGAPFAKSQNKWRLRA